MLMENADLVEPLNSEGYGVASNNHVSSWRNLAVKVGICIFKTLSNPGEYRYNDGQDTDAAIFCMTPYLIYLIAFSGVVIAIYTLIYLREILILVISAASLLLISFLLAIQKMKLQNLKTTREEVERLRGSCTKIATGNRRSIVTRTRLDSEIESLRRMEEQFQEFYIANGLDVAHLKGLLKQLDDLQVQVEKILERSVLEHIISAILASDRNGDFLLDEKEKEKMLIRVSNMKGVQFDKQNFRACVEKSEGPLTLSDAARLIRNLMDDDLMEDENVFHLSARDVSAFS